ncbi:helix-turn-helix domain-containing protein [Amycolatopsis sp. CA-230715]|uniref:helix-turn-helix domain-containing protein n=1 Tax=Amycolatopsis sp. CA-230715 TaxID=2745196 RepID=UPI001C33A8D6|nr:helix-turn-helix domain-containing protein [Amycolatopsis sp. CA-230715]QWF79856.1 hypothetical protein HUW46_03269 [Amycolatopsis sp. CA-230715]
MSALVGSADRDVLLADKRELQQAQQLVSQLPRSGARFSVLGETGGAPLPVPDELSRIIAQVVHAVAQGGTVTVSAMPKELTTTAAAKLLGVSRPTLMRMVNAGQLPSHKVGSHTRLLTTDVLQEQRARRQRQLKAFHELRALEDE